MLSTDLIEQILSRLPNATIGVLGDLFLDRYFEIDAALDEPSVETGLTAYQVTRVRSSPGAAGTVMNNLVALGVGRVYPITVIGDDGEGYELRQALARTPAVYTGGILNWPGRRTPTYAKPMRSEAGQPPQELNRLDIKNRTPTPAGAQRAILDLLDEAWPQFDALIVLDQVSEVECGVVTTAVRQRLADLAAGEPGKFVLADSREQIGAFHGISIKPNQAEFFATLTRDLERTIYPDAEGQGLARRNGAPIFCTQGPHGIKLYTASGWTNVPGYPVHGPTDICGAGDSTSAGIACAVAADTTHPQAAAFGNLVASITVQQLGTTGTATPNQVRERWRQVAATKHDE